MLDYGELATMQTKIDVLNWVTGRTTAIFEWYGVTCGSKNRCQERHVLKRDRTRYLKIW